MSVLIKDMAMPNACVYRQNGHLTTCPLYDVDGYCGALGKEASHEENNRHTDCPLIEIPPHGRLIDADALASEMEKQISNQDELMELCKSAGDTKNYFNSSKVQIGMVSFLRALNDSPTIIEAEEGE